MLTGETTGRFRPQRHRQSHHVPQHGRLIRSLAIRTRPFVFLTNFYSIASKLILLSDNLPLFNTVNNKLLNPPGLALRHIPLKLYLPSLAPPSTSASNSSLPQSGTIRVVQQLIPLQTPTRQPLTLGAALNTMLPTVFPSRRNPVLAAPAMHGAFLPMNAGIEELGRAAGFADGWCHIAIVMLG